MLFKVEGFLGEFPLVEPHLLPDNAAQVAKDCQVISGSIRPLKNTTFISTPTKAGTKKTIYKFGGAYWFHWLTDVDCLRGPIASDAAEVTYFTGDGAPRVTDSAIAVQGGGTDYPNNSFLLGVPAPTTAPSGAVTGASVDPTQAADRVYVVTFVAGIGSVLMEGPPSPVSADLVVEPQQGVTLSLPTVPAGAYNFLYKYIYRTANAGAAGSTEYKFVAAVSATTTSYSDTVAGTALGEALQSMEYDPPPADMHSLTLHPGGFMVGASGNDLCPSVAYQPHAYPGSYRLKTDYPIVGLGIFGSSILVLTTAFPYIVTGSSPDSLSMERLEIRQSCISKRGIVDMGYAVAFPSPDGLMVIGLGVAKNATEKLLTRDQWQALNPSTLLGDFHDGKYIGFYDGGCFILDPNSNTLTFSSATATATCNDAVNDTLYLVVSGDIVSWNTGTDKTYTWRTKKIVTPRPVNFGVCQVLAEGYPVTCKVYADGVLKHTQAVVDRNPFRLPSGFLAEVWEVEVAGVSAVNSIKMAEAMREMA